MKAIQILPTNATSLKRFMKMENISVLRCVKNGMGVLITIKNENNSIEKAVKFFNNFNLTRKDGSIITNKEVKCEYVDFGTLFNTQVL